MELVLFLIVCNLLSDFDYDIITTTLIITITKLTLYWNIHYSENIKKQVTLSSCIYKYKLQHTQESDTEFMYLPIETSTHTRVALSSWDWKELIYRESNLRSRCSWRWSCLVKAGWERLCGCRCTWMTSHKVQELQISLSNI